MAATVFDRDITLGSSSGNGCVIRVWAEQEGGTVSWYAHCITQYYARSVDHVDPETHQAYRVDTGCLAAYITLRVGGQTSDKVQAMAGTTWGNYGSWTGGDVRTAHETQPTTDAIAVAAPFDRYDVYLDCEGPFSGTKQVQEAVPLLAFVNVSGAVKDVRAVYAGVSGTVKPCAVWTSVGGTIRKIG